MKFPTLKKSEAKRQQIFERTLVVSKEIAEKEGVDGLTARRIAKDVGCSVGTIYNVFGGLDAVILHLNSTTLESLHEELAQVDTTNNPVENVNALVRRYMKFTEVNSKLWGVIFENTWPQDHILPDWYLERINGLLGLLATALQPLFIEEQKTEQIRAATALWCGLHGISSLAVSGKLGSVTSETALEMANMLAEKFMEGLQKR